MLQQNDEKHEAAHARIRADVRQNEEDTRKLRSDFETLSHKFDRVDGRPVDIATVVMSTKQVSVVVAACCGIAASFWIIRSDVHDLGAQITTEAATRKEQTEAFKLTLEDVKRELKLYELKADGIEKSLITKGVIR